MTCPKCGSQLMHISNPADEREQAWICMNFECSYTKEATCEA